MCVCAALARVSVRSFGRLACRHSTADQRPARQTDRQAASSQPLPPSAGGNSSLHRHVLTAATGMRNTSARSTVWGREMTTAHRPQLTGAVAFRADAQPPSHAPDAFQRLTHCLTAEALHGTPRDWSLAAVQLPLTECKCASAADAPRLTALSSCRLRLRSLRRPVVSRTSTATQQLCILPAADLPDRTARTHWHSPCCASCCRCC